MINELKKLWKAENIKLALVFIFGTGLSQAWDATKYVMDKKEQKEKIALEQNKIKTKSQEITALTRMFDIRRRAQKIMEDLLSSTNANRIVLLLGQDGGKPEAGRPFKTSIIMEAYSKNQKPIINEWQNQPSDGEYIAMLERVNEFGKVENVVSEMPQSILKDRYQSKKITKSIVYEIRETPIDFLYLSITFKNNVELSASGRDDIRRFVNDLINVFKKS